MPVTIRNVDPFDFAASRRVIDTGFKAKGEEETVEFLDDLRGPGCIVGERLAEDNGTTIGHIVFSRVWLKLPDGHRLGAAMLTPLAVHPDYQRQGTGLALMSYALEELEARGETLFLSPWYS